jgi:hypothetical protein
VKSPEKRPAATVVEVHDLANLKGNLKPIGGSMADDWNNMVANQTVQTLWVKHSDSTEITNAPGLR